MNIIIVTGSSEYTDQLAVNNALNDAKANLADLAIVQGGNHNGADWLASKWALSYEVPCFTCKAPSAVMGARAPQVRNDWMLKFMPPNYIVAFGDDANTQDMVAKAEAAGVPVWKIP